MTIVGFIKSYAVALPVFLVIDLVWLGIVARSFYRDQLGTMMRADPDWAAALAFYLVFVAGIVVFVVGPAVEKESLARALALGAFFGLVTYAAFDLTSLAVLQGFPPKVAAVDLLWGSAVCATVSAITYAVRTHVFVG